jgi:acetyl-CoA acetyltransferase
MTMKEKNPWAALEGRLLGICTQLERSVRLVPAGHQELGGIIAGNAEAVAATLRAVENLRCGWDNDRALAGLAVVNQAVLRDLRGPA